MSAGVHAGHTQRVWTGEPGECVQGVRPAAPPGGVPHHYFMQGQAAGGSF